MTLTARWTSLRHNDCQYALTHTTARYIVVPAGRRSGKTELEGKRMMVMRAVCARNKSTPQFYRPYADPRFGIGAPTRDQAKRIYWNDVKRLIPRDFIDGTPNESELIIRLVNGAEIHILGMDRPERAEGVPWDWFCLDEYGNMKPDVWPEHVRPSLADRKGGCSMIGVPEGRNHYYDLYKRAQADTSGEWATFTWPSSEILPPEEVEAARRDLDELTFQQEFEGSFVSFAGRAYWAFDERLHCAVLNYDPRLSLVFAFDFNVDPGTVVVLQEQECGTAIIGEVYIERASNSIRVSNKLAEIWSHHTGRIICYGDATGGARGSAKVMGSDWQLIKEVLWKTFGQKNLLFHVPPGNPRERERVNAVNSRLKSASGEVRLQIDPSKAPHMVKDLEGVVTIPGGSGEIDDSDSRLGHISDALGYYISYEFPIKKQYAPLTQQYWK